MVDSKAYLEADGLYKSYDRRAVVKNVSLKLLLGEVVGLLGPNGAGKTTSFYIIAGLVKADKGNITFSGKDITGLPIHMRAMEGVGYLPQEASIFRDLTAEANIYSALENREMLTANKRSLLASLVEEFGLEKVLDTKGSLLSGGERRRVEIARALALGPKFLLLDEPFAGIDPLAVTDIQNIIKGLKNRGVGVLITDHNVRETLEIVDRAYIINSGEVLVSGTPEEIINDDRARRFYLGEQFRM